MDIKNLLKQKDELREIWDYYAIDTPFPDKDVRLWLPEYGRDMVESAFTALAKRENKVDEPVKWLAGKLRNSKLQNMSPEEREAHISELRAGAARVKAQKQHLAKVKAEKEAFAAILQKDAEFCTNLQDVPVLVPVSVSVPLSVSVPAHVAVLVGKPAAAAQPVVNPPPREEKSKATPKPKPKYKIKTCPTCKGILHRSVNHTCPAPPTCIDCGFTGREAHECVPVADEANQEKATPKARSAIAGISLPAEWEV
jgi:hypothetical protein